MLLLAGEVTMLARALSAGRRRALLHHWAVLGLRLFPISDVCIPIRARRVSPYHRPARTQRTPVGVTIVRVVKSQAGKPDAQCVHVTR